MYCYSIPLKHRLYLNVSTILTIIFTYVCNTTVIIVIVINVTINRICSSLFKRS